MMDLKILVRVQRYSAFPPYDETIIGISGSMDSISRVREQDRCALDYRLDRELDYYCVTLKADRWYGLEGGEGRVWWDYITETWVTDLP